MTNLTIVFNVMAWIFRASLVSGAVVAVLILIGKLGSEELEDE